MPVGSVKGIEITDDGHAEIKHVDRRRPRTASARHARRDPPVLPVRPRQPLRRPLAPARHATTTIPDGGVIDTDKTVTQVDLDELYNTLDPETRQRAAGLLQGLRPTSGATGRRGQRRLRVPEPGALHLPPPLQRAHQGHAGPRALPRGQLQMVTALAERRDDLAGLVGNLNETTRALGSQKEALAESIGAAPAVHAARQHDVREPQIDPRRRRSAGRGLEAGGEAPGPFLSQARAFAADAEPTVRDLSLTIRQRRPRERPDRPDADVPAAGRDRHGRRRTAPTRRAARATRSARRAARSRRPSTRSRAARRRSASRARTPPTSSAGSTTSRRPAAASTPWAPPRAASSRMSPRSCTRTRSRRSSTSAARARPRRPPKDGSNVLSPRSASGSTATRRTGRCRSEARPRWSSR